MCRRIFVLFMLGSTAAAAACGSQSAALPGPSSMATLNGTWVGAASDSSGSMMGSGMSGTGTGALTWQLTQHGSAFSGTMHLAGFSDGAMMVTGSINGKTGSFTMTMPMGSMMSRGCRSTATGTFDMDDLMQEMHGSYEGTNDCGGWYDHGQISLRKR